MNGARTLAGSAAQSMRHSANLGRSACATSRDVGTDAKLKFSAAAAAMQPLMKRAARTLTPAHYANVHNKIARFFMKSIYVPLSHEEQHMPLQGHKAW